MGISLFIALLFVLSLALLIYGITKRNQTVKRFSIFILVLSVILGILIFNLIGYM
jgi:uncharacterized membrane protein